MDAKLRLCVLLVVLGGILFAGIVITFIIYKDTGFPITYVPACDCPQFLTELARGQ